MKLKALTAFLLAGVMAAAVMAGCTKKETPGTSSNGGSSNATNSSDVSSEAPAGPASGKLKDVHKAVKELFGEAYIPSMEIDATMLEEQYGIKKDMVKEVIAEGPMISTHVDVFIGIEAVEGKAEEVEKALKAYRDKIAADTMQYPMNLAKVQAATVERVGNYVFFVLLGETTNEAMDMEEAEQLKYYQGENKKAMDKIKEVLGQ